MFNKSFTIKTVNEVIKDVIIPNLSNDMAKEQAIAMLAVLKNLDTNTLENTKPKEQLTVLIKQSINEILWIIQEDYEDRATFTWAEELWNAVLENDTTDDVSEKWKRLNEVQCRLLRFLYMESAANPEVESKYIYPLRKRIREQLTIEMVLVR
jgi:hypothetical protein